MWDRSPLVIEEIDFLVAEAAEFAAAGPQFRVEYRAGELIRTAWFMHQTREYQLLLPTAVLILFDYLVRNRHVGKTATQIEASIREDPLYVDRGRRTRPARRRPRAICRSSVKEYIKRVRKGLTLVFERAGVQMDPRKVLVSEPTVGNEVLYRLHARIQWVEHP